MSNLSRLLDRYKALVIFDTETSGLNPGDDQIIELAALRVERTQTGALRIAGKMDTFIKLPEGEKLPENIVTLTGITDRLLETEGVQSGTAVSRFLKLVKPGPVLMVAHNAQFDACFLRELLRGFNPGHLDWLDSLTVYKDRRAYPHKLANAIIAYELEDKVQNSHRAIDDVLALFEVLKAMDEERDDLCTYVNLFGYMNDPSAIVARAFAELYPGIDYHAQFVPDLCDESGNRAFGLTIFPDDGSTPIVCISAEAPISAAPELLAHELAHVATPEDRDHGEAWKEAEKAIGDKYDEILNDMIPDDDPGVLVPHEAGDGGILAMPLRDNIPDPGRDD